MVYIRIVHILTGDTTSSLYMYLFAALCSLVLFGSSYSDMFTWPLDLILHSPGAILFYWQSTQATTLATRVFVQLALQ